MSKRKIAGKMLSWAAAQYSGRVALIQGSDSRTFDEVESRSNRFAHALAHLGVHPGERLGVLLSNSFTSVETVFGAEKAGVVYVALNARHTLLETAAILNDAQAAAVLIGPEFAELGQALWSQVPTLRQIIAIGWSAKDTVEFEALLASMRDDPPAVSIDADDLLRIVYTSGTTGQPKGVAYTIERWYERLNNHFHAMEFRLGIEDAMLHVAPLTHAAGVHLLPCYLRGARNIIGDRFDPARVLEQIERHRITQIMCVPTMLSRLVDCIEGGMKVDLSSLNRIHYGTSPTPPDLIRRALRVFGPILRQQYGMSEAVQPLAILYPHDHLPENEGLLLSCGRPTANVHITIRGPDGVELEPDEIGEIAIAHSGIGKVAFWRRPELMREVVRDGWYYTGDLGRFDARGYLYIVGRSKDMIISGGFNIYAREVEDALASHPAVEEVAVIGAPDTEWGERVVAFVALKPMNPASKEQLLAHCAARIAGYKKPRQVEFVPALPRNDAGKIRKPMLQEMLTQGSRLESNT